MKQETTEDVARFVRMFETSEDAGRDARQEAEKARDYYDGKQLTSAELAALKKRRQPPVIENLIRPKIDYLCGLERQTRTDPMCYPRTMQDDAAAQVATDVLRYVADDQKLDIKRSVVFQNMLTEGYGAVEVTAKERKGVIDPVIESIAWDRVFFDPHSSQLDFSDASYIGYITWLDRKDAERMWPEKTNELAASFDRGARDSSDTFSDKPKNSAWVDESRERVRIVTVYYKDGEAWGRCVFTLGGIMENGASAYLDEDGKPECALIVQSAYVDRDNDRYGIIRDLFTLQDEVNKRRSKFLHLVNSRQVRVSRGYEGEADRIRKELARPDGVITADKDDLELIGTGDMSMGHFTLLDEAKQAIRGAGPNAHMQGKEGDNQSGRAILAMQQGGMTEMAPLLDSLRDFNMRVFRAIWNRVRQFWQDERWVRITDDEKAAQFFAVNTTKGAQALQKLSEALKAGKVDMPTAQQIAMQIQNDQAMMEPANVMAELDVDIQIDEVQNTPTLHAEQFEQLMGLASSGMVQLPPDLLIRASSLRDKQKLLDLLEEQKEQQGQGQQEQQQMQQRAIAAEIAGKEADAASKAADVPLKQAKTQETLASIQTGAAKLQIDAFQAGAG